MEATENKKRKAEELAPDLDEDDEVETTNEDQVKDDVSFLDGLAIQDLKAIAQERKISSKDIVEKGDLVKRIKEKLLADLNEGIPITKRQTEKRRDCPYLDTIDRKMLDFDFEKLCSVTLQNMNVYACLVCGKYFQGRGKNSQAYLHALQANHYVFINLHTDKVYCIPDDYEVIDSSLGDIKYLLNPKFTSEQIEQFDKNKKISTGLDGIEFTPGFLGLNNIKHTDYINVVLQVLVHVSPLRNYFVAEENYKRFDDPLLVRFSELIRKVYNPKAFKGQVSPHELLQAISLASKKRIAIGTLGDPLDFLQFFLNHLHRGLGGTKKNGTSIIHKIFQGMVEITTTDPSSKVTKEVQPYLTLSLDIPPPPLFKDESEKNIIPQIPIYSLLGKFDGAHTTHLISGHKKQFKLLSTPPFLIIHLKRFTKNNFFWEKNPTIVLFPLKNFDLKQYITVETDEPTKYNLIGNICHEGEAQKGNYKVHVLNKGVEQWLEMQDLAVGTIQPQMIPLSESYMLFYERQKK